MYLVFPVIVMVILAMFTFYLCPKMQDKHCRDHYDYDRKNKIQCPSLSSTFEYFKFYYEECDRIEILQSGYSLKILINVDWNSWKSIKLLKYSRFLSEIAHDDGIFEWFPSEFPLKFSMAWPIENRNLFWNLKFAVRTYVIAFARKL